MPPHYPDHSPFTLRSTHAPPYTLASILVAILDILMDSVGIGMGFFVFSYLLSQQSGGDPATDITEIGPLPAPADLSITLVFLYLIYMITELIFAILLLVGVQQRSVKLVELWLTFSLMNLLLKGVQLVYSLALDKETVEGALSSFCEPLIRSAMFATVYTYTHKLKIYQRRQSLDIYLVVREDF